MNINNFKNIIVNEILIQTNSGLTLDIPDGNSVRQNIFILFCLCWIKTKFYVEKCKEILLKSNLIHNDVLTKENLEFIS